MSVSRLLYLTAAFPDARGIKWVCEMMHYGIESLVLTGRTQGASVWPSAVGTRTALVPGLRSKNLFNPLLAVTLRKLAGAYSPDIVFVRDVFLAGYGIFIARRLGLPCYIDVADNYPEVIDVLRMTPPAQWVLKRILNKWEGFVLSKASGIIFVSNDSRDYVLRKHGLLNKATSFVVHNVPMGIKPRSTYRRVFLGRLVYIGTYDRGIRDLRTAIEGLKLYRARYGDNATLTVFTFHQDDLLRDIRACDVNDGLVRVCEPVCNDKLIDTLSEYDVGLVPHTQSGATDYTIPNKLFDYLCAGLRVLASSNRSLSTILAQTGGGRTYACGDAEDFARSLFLIKGDIENQRNLPNLEMLESRFSWSSQVRHVVEHMVRAGSLRASSRLPR